MPFSAALITSSLATVLMLIATAVKSTVNGWLTPTGFPALLCPSTSTVNGASCGLTEVHHAPENHKPDPEWYCSSLCRETETLCQEIYERPYNSFISDATANGLILMKLPETWSTNEKMFASGGQGHGFAASQPAVGLGATAAYGAGDVLKMGIGGGASKAAQTLSDYYIKRAEPARRR